MLERFSYLSGSPYTSFILKNWVSNETSNLENGPVKEIIKSNLLGSGAIYKGIKESTGNIVDSINQTTGAIYNSTDVLSEGIEKSAMASIYGSLITSGTIALATYVITKKMDKISIGIDRLGAQFSEGFSLMTTQLDIQTNKLNDIKNQLEKISETLSSPLITQAKEYRNLGLDRMNSGLWPEALDAFSKSIQLDETDPISNMMLGKLYLDAIDEDINLNDNSLSVEYFTKSIRYSKSFLNKAGELKEVLIESLFLKSIALLASAVDINIESKNIEKSNETLENSLKTIDQLLQISPIHLQGLFLKVKLLVLLDREEEAISIFKKLITEDPQFASLPLKDADFYQHTKIGKNVINSGESLIKDMIKNELDNLFILIDETKRLNIQLPDYIKNWIEEEGFSDREKSILVLKDKTYYDVINPDRPLLTILQIILLDLKNILKVNEDIIASEFINNIINRKDIISLVNREFIESEDREYLDDLLTRINKYSENDLNHMTKNELDSIINWIKEENIKFDIIKEKSEYLEKSYYETIEIFKKVSGSRIASVLGKTALFALINPLSGVGAAAASLTKNNRWNDPQGQKATKHMQEALNKYDCTNSLKIYIFEKLIKETS